MGRYIRGGVDETLTLTTLASRTVVSDIFDEVVNGRTLLSSMVGIWTMQNFTKSTGDGPILVGLAHPDYSAAEIEEWLETTDSWDEGNLIEKEISNRKIRKIGIFENPVDEAASVVLNHGAPIKTKLNWMLQQGTTLRWWAYNLGTSALATTAPTVHLEGHANLWPQ